MPASTPATSGTLASVTLVAPTAVTPRVASSTYATRSAANESAVPPGIVAVVSLEIEIARVTVFTASTVVPSTMPVPETVIPTAMPVTSASVMAEAPMAVCAEVSWTRTDWPEGRLTPNVPPIADGSRVLEETTT